MEKQSDVWLMPNKKRKERKKGWRMDDGIVKRDRRHVADEKQAEKLRNYWKT